MLPVVPLPRNCPSTPACSGQRFNSPNSPSPHRPAPARAWLRLGTDQSVSACSPDFAKGPKTTPMAIELHGPTAEGGGDDAALAEFIPGVNGQDGLSSDVGQQEVQVGGGSEAGTDTAHVARAIAAPATCPHGIQARAGGRSEATVAARGPSRQGKYLLRLTARAFAEDACFHNSSCGTCQRTPAVLAPCSIAHSPLVPSLPGTREGRKHGLSYEVFGGSWPRSANQ